MKKIIFVIFFVLGSLLPLHAQQALTKIKGTVTDAETGEPIPFVVVYFTGTTIGVTTDMDGCYYFETRQDVPPTIKAELLGYEVQEKQITVGGYTEVDFFLNPSTNFLNTVVVKADDKRIKAFLRKIYERKQYNDPQYKESYICDTYSKMELGMTNINPKMKNKFIQKNFGFVFSYMDTSVVSGTPYLPILISENNATTYFRKNPRLMREVIEASRISGVENNSSLSQFTGQLYFKVNLYDNYVTMFNVRIASPLSEHGSLYYDYYLVDSSQVNGRATYKVRFHPKATSSPVFDGEFAIDSATMALVSAHVKLTKSSNVNWLRDLVIDVENQMIDDSTWFYSLDKVYADFSVTRNDSSKMLSFIGSRTINYSNVKINKEIPKEVLDYTTDIIYGDSVLRYSEDYWAKSRPFELSEKERNIYQMVDSIQTVPIYNTIYSVVNTVLTGYLRWNKVEIGPYNNILSFNKSEGLRVQLGGRTTYKFHDHLRLSGYLAYGLKEKKFKGSGTVEYQFKMMPLRKLTLSYRHDDMGIGSGEQNFVDANLLGSIFSKSGRPLRNLVDRWFVSYESEWRSWLVTKFYCETNRIYGNDDVPLVQADGQLIRSIMTTSLGVGLRFGWDEAVTRNHFTISRIMRKYPVLTMDFRIGLKDMWNSYEYYRGALDLNYRFSLPPFGTSDFRLQAGKIWGGVPYPLLNLYSANTTYFYASNSFACMDDYEFVSDAWVTFFYEHNFKGFFLGKIPLIKHLKWREVVSFRLAYGSLEGKNRANIADAPTLEPNQILFPQPMETLTVPYMEAGVGITNIFKLIRVDFYWRLNHRYNPVGERATPWVVNVGLELDF